MYMFSTIDDLVNELNYYNYCTCEIINKFNKIGINVYPQVWEFHTDYTNSSIKFKIENEGCFYYEFDYEKLKNIIKLLSGETVIGNINLLLDLVDCDQNIEIKLLKYLK